MPQMIEVPGEGVVEFPDGMDDDAISTAVKANFTRFVPGEGNMIGYEPAPVSTAPVPPELQAIRDTGNTEAPLTEADYAGPLAGFRDSRVMGRRLMGLVDQAEANSFTIPKIGMVENPVAQVGAGLVDTVTGVVDSMSSLKGLAATAALASGGLAANVAGTVFAGEGVKGLPESASAIASAESPYEMTKAVAGGILSAGMVLPVVHGVSRGGSGGLLPGETQTFQARIGDELMGRTQPEPVYEKETAATEIPLRENTQPGGTAETVPPDRTQASPEVANELIGDPSATTLPTTTDAALATDPAQSRAAHVEKVAETTPGTEPVAEGTPLRPTQDVPASDTPTTASGAVETPFNPEIVSIPEGESGYSMKVGQATATVFETPETIKLKDIVSLTEGAGEGTAVLDALKAKGKPIELFVGQGRGYTDPVKLKAWYAKRGFKATDATGDRLRWEPEKQTPGELPAATAPAIHEAMTKTPGVLPGGPHAVDLVPSVDYDAGVKAFRKIRGAASLIDLQNIHARILNGDTPLAAAKFTADEATAHAYAKNAVSDALSSEIIESGKPAQDLYEKAYNEAKAKQGGRIEPAAPPKRGMTGEPGAMGPAEATEMSAASESNTTALKRAVVDVQSKVDVRGVPSRPGSKELIRQADDAMTADPSIGQKVVGRVLAKEGIENQEVSPRDAAVMLVERVRLRNERTMAEERMADPYLNESEKAEARSDFEAAESAINNIEQASRAAGTAWSDFGRIYQQVLKEDYTEAAIMSRARAKKGSGLSREEVVEIKAQAARIQEQTRIAEDRVQFLEKQHAETMADQAVRELEEMSEPKIAPRVLALAESIVSRIRTSADAARARIQERQNSVLKGEIRLSSGLDQAELYDYSIIGLEKLSVASLDFAKWSSDMVSDLGEGVRPFLSDVWTKTNELWDAEEKRLTGGDAEKVRKVRQKKGDAATERAGIVDGIKGAAEEGAEIGAGLDKHVKALAKNAVESGVRGLEAVTASVKEALKPIIPGITERQIQDAFSDYGKSTPAATDPVKVHLSEIRSEAQKTSALQDILEKQKAPAATGKQRTAQSDTSRRLTKLINEAKKRFNIQPTDPTRALKSALDSRKTYYRNRLADLRFEVAKRERIVKERSDAPTDPELDSIKAEYEQAKADHESIFGKREMSDEQRLKNAITAAERSELSAIKRLENAEKGIFEKPAGSKVPPSAQLDAVRARTAAMREQVKELYDLTPDGKKTAEERALQTYRTRLLSQEADLAERSARADQGDATAFAKKPRRVIDYSKDPELMRAQAAVGHLKNDIARKNIAFERARRTGTEKLLDGVSGWRRAFVLSGVHTLAKLTSAAGEIVGIASIEEGIGGALSKTPGVGRIAAKAPRHGGLSLKAEGEAISATVTKLFSDAGTYMRKGGTDLDAIYGKPHLYPFEFKELIGRMHGALKTPARRNEWTRSYRKRMEFAAKEGADINNVLVQTRIGMEAYADADRSIFMESNMVVDAYKRALSRFSQKDKSTGRPTLAGKLSETGAKVLLPVIRIPTNIVARTFEYTFGTVTGSFRMAKAFRRGIENLPPEQADLIMRNLKRGSLGAAVVTIGFLNPDSVGGYYNGKRSKDDVKAGEMRIFGVDLPKVLIHNPLLGQLQIGATMRRVADSKLRKSDKDTQGIGAGFVAAALGVLKETPFLNALNRTGEAIKNNETLGKWGGEQIRGIVIPQAMDEAAKLFDKDPRTGETVRRDPKTLLERLQSSVPLYRNELREKKKHR